MRRANMLVLLLALVMGGLAAFMARNWIMAHATVPPITPTGTIVVASAPLTFGTVLTRDKLCAVGSSASAMPGGAFASKEKLLRSGRRALLSPVARAEPILKTKITGPDQRASLSALLEEGMRAV